jgi:hypothetical protein
MRRYWKAASVHQQITQKKFWLNLVPVSQRFEWFRVILSLALLLLRAALKDARVPRFAAFLPLLYFSN